MWRLRDIKTFVLAAHCMEIVGLIDVYASGALYGDYGGTKTFVLAAHRRLRSTRKDSCTSGA